ncbi:MAG: BUD32 family EKC/KEOPS complex subunit [Planctomycetota bacterium]
MTERASERAGHAVRCLKQAGARSVWLRRTAGGDAVVVKTWPLGPLMLAKLAVGLSQPQRQRLGARRTAAAGIATTPHRSGPRLVVRRGRPRLELVHGFAPGDDAFELVRAGGLPLPDRVRLARMCGGIVARYAGAGLLHRDLKLSNLVVDPGRTSVTVIDTIGVRKQRDAAVATARMLERLDVQLREEAIDVGRAARLAALLIALRPLAPPQRRGACRWLRRRPAR